MRIALKWLLWFSGIGLYAMFLGGIFYYNLFKWTFDERLKQSVLDMVRDYAPTLIRGLSRSEGAITMDEYDIVSRFSKDSRIADLLYLNRYGVIRWFHDPTKIAETFDHFTKEYALPSDAIEQAWMTKAPAVRWVAQPPIYDVAIPLALRGEILGIIDLQASRAEVESVVDAAMKRYAVGALGVLLLLGVPLYFFLTYFILNPLLDLKDSLEGLSLKNPELKFAKRRDEIGDVAEAMGQFLGKMKAELEAARERQRERREGELNWWRSVLAAALAKNVFAIVVDEDNLVLHTTFPQANTGVGQPHLLDVIDSQQQEVLRLVASSMERPNQVLEAESFLHAEPCHVKSIHLQEGELKRTLILFELKTAALRV